MNLQGALARPVAAKRGDRISAHRDPMRVGIWVMAIGLVAAAMLLRGGRLVRAATTTGPPFLTLAVVIAAGLALDRAGVFRFLARLVVPTSATDWLAAVGVLGLTAVLSGVVNLDVAVVVAVPVALTVARERHLNAGRFAIAAALTANATSFLLPTSNLTTLLVLGHAPLTASTYAGQSWLAWLLVTALTVGALSVLVNRGGQRPKSSAKGARLEPSAPSQASTSADGLLTYATTTRRSATLALLDLLPMYAGASAIRALLDGGVTLHAGLLGDVGITSVFAASANNLPAAAAILVTGSLSRWATVLALAIGPNLLLTGSVASLIARRIARDHGTDFGAVQFQLARSRTASLPTPPWCRRAAPHGGSLTATTRH